METIIHQSQSFQGGAFITNENQSEYAPFDENKLLFLTQNNNSSLKNEILKLINESQNVLKICSFIITDKEIFNAILEKAKQYNVAIFILTQLDQTKLKNTSILNEYLTEEEIKENPSQAHMYCIKSLYDHGVHVRAATTAHAKFIVSDSVTGFLTSANLTTPSLTFNTESGVYLDRHDTIELNKLFDVIFQRGTRYRQYVTATKNKNFVVQTELRMEKEVLPVPEQSRLRYTYELLTNNLYHEINKIVNAANQFIYLSTYSIVGLESLPEFMEAIKNAITRGVIITIFCRGMNYRNDHLKSCEALCESGCHIFADFFNHSKGIINETTGLIFTANIDGHHGLINGFEVGYLLNEQQRVIFIDLHKRLIETSDYKFINKPSRKSFFDTYLKYETFKGIKAPQFPEDVTIMVKEGLKINLNDFTKEPIFYAASKDGKFLVSGNFLYRCNYKDGAFLLLHKENMRYDLEKYILKYLTIKFIVN